MAPQTSPQILRLLFFCFLYQFCGYKISLFKKPTYFKNTIYILWTLLEDLGLVVSYLDQFSKLKNNV